MRESLPIDKVREELKSLLKRHATLILVGPPGSGKSTQVPQLCLEAGFADGGDGAMIAVTEPRRIAAQSLAERVSLERGCCVGEEVGYKYRFEDASSDATRLLYTTDGLLLREANFNPTLARYSTIIVDEAHERSIQTDILLRVLKTAAARRSANHYGGEGDVPGPLRLILMSASMDAEKFSRYLNNAPIVSIPCTEATTTHYFAEEESLHSGDYLQATVNAVLQLHALEPESHGFLVFLTGEEEINAAVRAVNKAASDEGVLAARRGGLPKRARILPIKLHASVGAAMKRAVFKRALHGERKVVFATNVAETSLTIPGIRVVIDCGKVKQRSFSTDRRVDVLHVVDTSKAQALQRAGRASREASGKCYHLYSYSDYAGMQMGTTPEIQRANLVSVLLEMVGVGIRRYEDLQLIDLPSRKQFHSAIETLTRLGAIKEVAGRLVATTLGRQLQKFPVEASHARILLAASDEYHCLDEATIVVAFLNSSQLFSGVHDDDGGGRDDKEQYPCADGDHVRAVKIYRDYKAVTRLGSDAEYSAWCIRKGLLPDRLEGLVRVRDQLRRTCRKNGLAKRELSSCGEDFLPLRKAIYRGLALNACSYDSTTGGYRLESGALIKIHPSSCLARRGAVLPAFVFSDLVQTSATYARNICPIDREWMAAPTAPT